MHQLLHQFPSQFEFNSKMLKFIAKRLYTCEYGTFLGNCERERVGLRGKTASVWTAIHTRKSKYLNPFFLQQTQLRLTKIPNTAYFELHVWKELYFRHSPQYFDQRQAFGVTYPTLKEGSSMKDQVMAETQKTLTGVLNFLMESSQQLISRIGGGEHPEAAFTTVEDPASLPRRLSEQGFEIIKRSEGARYRLNSQEFIPQERKMSLDGDDNVSLIHSEEEVNEMRGAEEVPECLKFSLQSNYIT